MIVDEWSVAVVNAAARMAHHNTINNYHRKLTGRTAIIITIEDYVLYTVVTKYFLAVHADTYISCLDSISEAILMPTTMVND
jgi:hypothetical protein